MSIVEDFGLRFAQALRPSSFDLILARITQDACSAAHGLSNSILVHISPRVSCMMQNTPHLELALVRQVQTRTGRRIRDLAVELLPEGVILRGYAATYYLKQL